MNLEVNDSGGAESLGSGGEGPSRRAAGLRFIRACRKAGRPVRSTGSRRLRRASGKASSLQTARLPPQTKMSLAKAVRTMMAPSMSIMSMVVASPFS